MLVYLLAGNARQAALWASAHKMHPNQWRYIESVEMCQGILPGSDVVRVGSWYTRWDAEIIQDQLKMAGVQVR